jgi:hypothetical protein
MEWSQLYSGSNEPANEAISRFINNDLWSELNAYLQQTYNTQPKLAYSKCSCQRGWNIKYQKSGKSLCTLYPMQGYFIALVVMGEHEQMEVELALPTFTEYFQRLYRETKSGMGQKWLMIEVTDAAVLNDVKRCIAIRKAIKTI